jgi:hypothetical protein
MIGISRWIEELVSCEWSLGIQFDKCGERKLKLGQGSGDLSLRLGEGLKGRGRGYT